MTALVVAARKFLGVPWRHLGRTRAGVDCIGLVLLAAREIGHDLPDPAPYERKPQGARLVDGLARHARRVADPLPGDVLVFRTGLFGGHVGIATSHRTYGGAGVLHAYATHRHVVEQPLEAELQRELVGAWRLAEG
jgi:cell wall-associated NlpC family hydrolase